MSGLHERTVDVPAWKAWWKTHPGELSRTREHPERHPGREKLQTQGAALGKSDCPARRCSQEQRTPGTAGP